MPNLLTKTTQWISESLFKGNKTNDEEFQQLVEKMKAIESGVTGLKKILQNFINYTSSIGNLFQELSESIGKIYDPSSPFYKIGKDVHDAHELMFKEYNDFYKTTSKLSSKTSEWLALFTQAKDQIEKREEKRKVYDHYEQKLNKLYEKESKGKNNKKDEEQVARNEEKFKKAAQEYVTSSEESFKSISEILDRRYAMINPVCSDLIIKEVKFFSSVSRILKPFEEIDILFDETKTTLLDNFHYDPWKSIKGRDLMKKVSFRKTRAMSQKITDAKIGNSITGIENNDTINEVFEEKIRSSFDRPDDSIITGFMSIKDDLVES